MISGINKFDENKPIFILDLDETVICSKDKFELKEDLKLSDTTKRSAEDYANKHNLKYFHMQNGDYYVFGRPGVDEFMKYLFDNFNLIVWTAASGTYGFEIIDNLLAKDRLNDVKVFMWSVHCDVSEKKYNGIIKNLKYVYNLLKKLYSKPYPYFLESWNTFCKNIYAADDYAMTTDCMNVPEGSQRRIYEPRIFHIPAWGVNPSDDNLYKIIEFLKTSNSSDIPEDFFKQKPPPQPTPPPQPIPTIQPTPTVQPTPTIQPTPTVQPTPIVQPTPNPQATQNSLPTTLDLNATTHTATTPTTSMTNMTQSTSSHANLPTENNVPITSSAETTNTNIPAKTEATNKPVFKKMADGGHETTCQKCNEVFITYSMKSICPECR